MLDSATLLSSYKEISLAPSFMDHSYAPERTAVNCVALITNQKWTDVVKSLIEIAHYRGNMPSYKTCITDLFRKNGFKPVRYIGRIAAFLEECNMYFEEMQEYIIKTSYGYFAVVPDDEAGKYLFKGLQQNTRCISNYFIDELWQYFPGTDNRSGIKRQSHKERTLSNENQSLEFVNMNPENKYVGDCSVRGLAAAYGCTWHEAIDHIASSIGYSDPFLNITPNINSALINLGFERHKPIKCNGRRLTGKQFCERMDYTYSDGERIFAYIGRSHCAAILPIKQADGSFKYKIQDTWDSTSHPISEWWLYKEPASTTVLTLQDAPKIIPAFNCGDKIKHPRFGNGVILSVTGDILEVEFENAGIKNISESWLKKQNEV